ncbi:MAG: hypothetical protein FIA82_09945 [Melioribacter sp.]|nr:hypothetical protein [Melioribacter sp.]
MGIATKKIKIITVILFFILFLNSCGLIDQDAHSSSHEYNDPNYFGKVDIYFLDLDKNIFFKIANGGTAGFVPKSDLVVYSKGTNPMYSSSPGINCIKIDGTGDISLAAKSTSLFISSKAPIISPNGDKVLFTASGSYYLVNVDGSFLTKIQLTDGQINLFSDYSKDGKKILFQSNKGLVIYEVDSKTYKVISSVENIDIYISGFSPRFSFDGNSIIYFYQSSTQFIMGKINLSSITNKILYSPADKFSDRTYSLHMCSLPDDKIVFEDISSARICYFDLKNEKPINFFGSSNGTLESPSIFSEKIIDGKKILYKENTSMFLYDLETKTITPYSFPVTPLGILANADFTSDLKKLLYYKNQ